MPAAWSQPQLPAPMPRTDYNQSRPRVLPGRRPDGMSSEYFTEDHMAIKILIKRQVPEHLGDGLDYLLIRLRALTLRQEGYISGESFRRIDKPGQSLVISTWQTLDDWRRWASSPERADLQNEIDIMLDTPTEYEVYENI
jgi:heme oxygenase (mycobilin-producing)